MTFLRLAGLLLAAVLLSVPRAEAETVRAPVHLMILGDSLTAGYGLPAQDGFQARLAAALKAQGADVVLVDAAVSGDTTADAAARLDWALGGGEVDAALVELGGNDGLRGLDPALMRHNLTHILDTFQAKHIPVLLSGMIAPPNLGRDYGARFTAVFTALGRRPGVLYDPFFLAGLVGHPEYAQADGIHPDSAGVAIEVKRLLPLILTLIGEPQVRDNARANEGGACRSHERMRLFVAIDLPWPLRDRLAGLSTGIMGARWMARENLHLTLRFIGEVPNWRAEEIDLALHGMRGRGFPLVLSGVGLFEKAGRVTALWAGVERSSALEHLQAKVETALQRAGLEPERRRFIPHVTLARLDHPANEKITSFVQRNNLFRAEAFSVDRFTLFSSQLGKEGSVYTAENDYSLS